ncbi:hypothetical protein A2U01_0076849, partial [Trifolium medium]|nr:hypothetical protein [Trifolium medium]
MLAPPSPPTPRNGERLSAGKWMLQQADSF